jgi:hypothetical protein
MLTQWKRTGKQLKVFNRQFYACAAITSAGRGRFTMSRNAEPCEYHTVKCSV